MAFEERVTPVQFEEGETFKDQLKAKNIQERATGSLRFWEHPGSSIDQAKRLLGMGDRKVIQAPGLSEQEQVIIARMKELATGDPELGQLYTDFTFRALEGEEGVTPGLRRDIAEQEAITKEEIARGLGSTGDIRSTAGIRRMGRFREKANIVRERAKQDAIRRGEGLIGSRSRRMIAAAGTALGPLAQQRGLESAAQLQTAANVAGEKAGLMRLGGQLGGIAVTQARRT
jgi:hypothetical protein